MNEDVYLVTIARDQMSRKQHLSCIRIMEFHQTVIDQRCSKCGGSPIVTNKRNLYIDMISFVGRLYKKILGIFEDGLYASP